MSTYRGANSPTLANVAYSATSVTLFGLSQNVTFRSVYNDADKPCYIAWSASPASTTNFSVKLAAGGYYEFPPGTVYNNQATIIWDAAGAGAARTTQF